MTHRRTFYGGGLKRFLEVVGNRVHRSFNPTVSSGVLNQQRYDCPESRSWPSFRSTTTDTFMVLLGRSHLYTLRAPTTTSVNRGNDTNYNRRNRAYSKGTAFVPTPKRKQSKPVDASSIACIFISTFSSPQQHPSNNQVHLPPLQNLSQSRHHLRLRPGRQNRWVLFRMRRQVLL